MIQGLAKHYKFDVQKPWNELPEKIRKIVLYGNEGEKIQFKYENKKKGNKWAWQHAFEGIIPNMQRRYSESDSAMVREELGKYQSTQPCATCNGARLNAAARNVFVQERALPEIASLSVVAALEFFGSLSLKGWRGEIAEKIVNEIRNRLRFLADVGLGYLSLDRSADTLSGGEAQRIRLASQIGSGLVGVMYILDEPSIGLHQRDNQRLLDTLLNLRDLGNTVLVVEHDREAILAADHVVDLGPGAGVHGGQVVASGTPGEIMANAASLTGQYLSGRREIPLPSSRREFDPQLVLEIQGARGNNLKNVTVQFPVGLMTCVTGVSGSGKSTLVNDTLYRLTAQYINKSGENSARVRASEGPPALRLRDRHLAGPDRPYAAQQPGDLQRPADADPRSLRATPESRSRGYEPGASAST